MSFFTSLSKQTTTILLVSMVSLSISIPLIACSPSQQHEKTDSSTEHESKTADSQNNSENAQATDTDMTMSQLTLETALQAFQVPMKSSGEFDKETIKCIEDIKPNFALDKVQKFYESKLTPEEMKTLNQFYSSDLGKSFTEYGRDEFLVAVGQTVENPAPKPTEEQMKKMMEFTQTPTGIKYGKLNMEEGEGSLNDLITGLMTEELSKCNVKL